PLLLYPVLGFAVLQFAAGFVERPSVIAVVRGPGGSTDFPPPNPAVLQSALTLPPVGPVGAGVPPGYLATSAALGRHPALTYPLFLRDGNLETFPSKDKDKDKDDGPAPRLEFKFMSAEEAHTRLLEKEVDLVLSADQLFWYGLGQEKSRSFLQIQT